MAEHPGPVSGIGPTHPPNGAHSPQPFPEPHLPTTFTPIDDPPPPTAPMPTSLELSCSPTPAHQSNHPISHQLTLRLYTSHFLSTWNSRLFEFGAVLFLASIFPDTLMPMSLYALVRSGAAILFAQSVGAWIDRGDRLVVVRASIVGQRVAVVGSCALFWAMESRGKEMGEQVRNGLFGLVVVLACVEKLGAVMNLVAVERDWVVVVTEGREGARRSAYGLMLGEDRELTGRKSSMPRCAESICYANSLDRLRYLLLLRRRSRLQSGLRWG